MLAIKQGGITANSYCNVVTITYPIAFSQKVLNGQVTTIHPRDTDGSCVPYFYNKSLTQGTAVNDSNGGGPNAPIFYLVFGF